MKYLKELDLDNIPKHIAIIMDGNGRWAQTRGLPRLEGHRRGYIALKDVVYGASDIGVETLTVYAFSSENWRRPDNEVSGLMKLIQYAAKIELNEMKKKGVKIIVSGRIDELPEGTRNQLLEDVEETKNNSSVTLNLAVNYGGRNEIVDAVKEITKQVKLGEIDSDSIDSKTISNNMYHPELPDPDLLIRTSGELRISNFLLWECAYSEIYVTDTLWPDFHREQLYEAILSYQNRIRKFGKTAEQVE